MPTAKEVEQAHREANDRISILVKEIAQRLDEAKRLADEHQVEFQLDVGDRTYNYYPGDRYSDDGFDGGWTSSQNC